MYDPRSPAIPFSQERILHMVLKELTQASNRSQAGEHAL
jgi:hypothetical protein